MTKQQIYKATHAQEHTKKGISKSKKDKKAEKKAAPKKHKSLLSVNTHEIKNREKRNNIVIRQTKEKERRDKKLRKERQQEYQEGKEKLQAITIEDKRNAVEENLVFDSDSEIIQEEQQDEFQKYFKEEKEPKIFMTTNIRPKGQIFDFLKEIKQVFPHCYYYPRKNYSLQEICKHSYNRGYTDVMCWREHNRKVDELIMIHLPDGPTASFSVTSDILHDKIHNKAAVTDHFPELVLNNFNSKLGRRIGRFFASLFPQKPEFEGRRVVTFHNQRDFIFFRHHRYEIDQTNEKVNIQEIGPRFTLKLKRLQLGIFDNVYGEVEYERKNKMYSDRKATYL